MGGGGPPGGVSHTFPPASSSVCGTHPHAFVCPYFHQRGSARGDHPGFDCQGCCGACSSSVSRLLQPPVCGLEDLGVVASCHRPVSPQSLRGRVALPHGDHPVCSSVCPTGGLNGLHRPSGGVSPGSCSSGISSLPALCGSWPHLPVHSAVLRPIHGPTGLHSGYGSCVSYNSFLGYPYASLPGRLARPGLLRDLEVVLSLCRELGDRSQPGEVQLLSVQVVQYLGVIIYARTFMASPSPDRVSRLRSTTGEFLWSAAPPASLWQSLLGMLSSLSHLVPGGHLRMRSLQICLHRSWDRLNPSVHVAWSPECLRDLRCWLRGVSPLQVSPDLGFWSDASDVGWVAHLGDRVVSSLWDQSEALLPVNARELLAVRRGLLHFQYFLSGTTVAVFCDNVTAVAYLSKEGGTRSPVLNTSVGRNLFRFGWLPSSFRGSAMFSRTLSPVLISSPAQSGLSTWMYFDL